MGRQTPVTVVGGFLGSGKTTLLNHVLHHASGTRYAVLVNDFGALSVDDRLVVKHEGDTIQFANGCVCCSLGGSMLNTVDRLLDQEHPPDQFLIEASGVSDPRAIADLAVLHPDLRRDLTVILCDGTSIRRRADDSRLTDTVCRQLESADVLLLNHCDRVREADIADIKTWLEMLSAAPIVVTERAQIDLEVLNAWPSMQPLSVGTNVLPLSHPFHTCALSGRLKGDIEGFAAGLRALEPAVLRAKGFVTNSAGDRCWIAHRVGDYVTVSELTVTPEAGSQPGLVVLSAEPLADVDVLAERLGLINQQTALA